MRWTELKACLSILFINFIVFISELSLIKWRSTSYFSWNSIQTSVNILYKKCCKVVTCREFFYNFFCKCFSLCTLPSRDLFPIFANVQCHIIKKLTDLNRSGSTGKYPTSVLLYWPRHRSVNTAKNSVDIFPYYPHSRSVSYYSCVKWVMHLYMAPRNRSFQHNN